MSTRNKSKRNRRSILATLKAHNTIQFERDNMVPGIMYRYPRNGWLFALRSDGTLATDCGDGLSDLRSDTSDHSHWFCTGYRTLIRTNLMI